MKISMFKYFIILIIIIFSTIIMCISTEPEYKTGQYVDFEYPVPDGMITDKIEKQSMIEAKIENLKSTNSIFWGNLPENNDNMQQLFQMVWSFLRTNFPAFDLVDADWDKLGDDYYYAIDSLKDYGEYTSLMMNMAFNLHEGHMLVVPGRVYGARGLSSYQENSPVYHPFTYKVDRIGACYTVTDKGEMVFLKLNGEDNPYNIRPGDEFIGFNGVPWQDWVKALIESGLPIFGAPASNDDSFNYGLLKSGMSSAMMFETINIKRYDTDEIETYPIQFKPFSFQTWR